jgi:hypothetical protein
MAMMGFDAKALAVIDGGRIAEAINQELRKAALDCDDRPGDKRARKVTLQLEIVPKVDDRGNCDSVDVTAQVKAIHPSRKSQKFDMSLRKNGVLAFNEESLDNADQRTLDLK